MVIWPTSLLAQERQGIPAPLRRHKTDPARSTQMVDHEKDLVPREVGALARDVFEVACACVKDHVEHLIFRGDLLLHVPPVKKRNEVLRG